MNTYGTSYIFEWIDSLIAQVVNPDLNHFVIVDERQMEELSMRFQQESILIKSQIKNQLFTLTKQNKREILVSQYHSTLTLLLNQVLRHKKENRSNQQNFEKIALLIQASLEEMLNFIETRYAGHINPNEQISVSCYDAIREEVKDRIEHLTVQIGPDNLKNPVLEIVLKRLKRFVESDFSGYRATYRTIFYKKALVQGLEELPWDIQEPEDFSHLDKLLIYLNFNSKTYINLLISSLKARVAESSTAVEKLSRLQFYQKAFKQVHAKPKTVLNPDYYSLDTIINKWFKREITYLKETIFLGTMQNPFQSSGRKAKEHTPKARQKIICNLSSDQIALILKAADDAKLLVAHSMSEVFKTIVPHLSTPQKEDLSYNAMRVKTYNIEDRDKEVAIEVLQSLINKIKQY